MSGGAIRALESVRPFDRQGIPRSGDNRPRVFPARSRATPFAAAVVASALLAQSAVAADATWNVNAAGNWVTPSSWNPAAAPGATAGNTNTDTATFGTIINAARVVTVDANRNILGINFAGNSSAYTLSSGNLLLTNAGLIQTSGGGTAHTDVISAPIALQGDGGTATFTGGSSTATRILSISGALTGVSTGANQTVLTLNGTNTGNNSISGGTGNGSGGGSLAIVKSGAGTWRIAGTNTFSGGVTLNQGTLMLNSATALGATAGTFVIAGGTTIDNNSGAVQTIANSNPITVNGDFAYTGTNTLSLGTGAVSLGTAAGTTRTITTGALTLTLGGVVSDGTTANSIVKQGNGALVLGNAANAYTGTTTINGGVLQFNSAGGIGGSGQSVTVNAGGALSLNFTGLQAALNARVDPSAAGTIAVNTTSAAENVNFSAAGANMPNAWFGANGTVTYTGTFTPFANVYRLGGGGGTLTYGAAIPAGNSVSVGTGIGGTVVLTGANAYDGGTTLNVGTLAFNDGSLGTGLVTMAGTSTLRWNGTNTQDISSQLRFTDATTATLDTGANNVTLASPIQVGALASTSVTKIGTGTLTLGGPQTYTGTTLVLGGTLAAGVTNPLPVTNTVTIGNQTTSTGNLSFANFDATIGALNVTSDSATVNTVTIGAGRTFTVNGNVLFGAAGNGSTTAATFTGAGGTFAVNSAGGSFQVGGATANGNGNTATVDMTALGTFNADLGAAGTFRVGDNNAGGSGPASGASVLRLAANSTIRAGTVGVSETTSQNQLQTLTLGSGANVFNANTISVTGSGSPTATQSMRANGIINFPASTPSATVTITGYGGTGTTADLNIASTNTNTSANTNVTGTVDFSGHVANLSLGNVVIGNRVQLGAAISTTGSLTLDGATSLSSMNTLLAGARSGTTSNATSITSGTLSVLDGTVNIGTLVAPPAAGAVRLGDSAATSGVGTAIGTLQVSGGNVTVGANGTSGTAVTLANSVTAAHTATGVINVTGGGSLTVQGHIVRGATTGLVGVTTGITLDGPTASLDMTGRNIGTTAAPIPVASFQQGTLSNVNQINGNGTAAANGIAKTLAGTLTLAGTNAWTGPTTVSAGTLMVNGLVTQTSGVAISGATLGGIGTITPTGAAAAAVTLDANSVLAPGASIGSLTIDGAASSAASVVALAGGATLSYELNNAFQSDLLAITGAAAGDVSFGGNPINFADLSAGTLAPGQYVLVAADVLNAYTGLTVDGGNIITAGLTIGTGLEAYPGSTLQVAGNNIVLNVVPEPGAAGVLAGAAGLLLRRRRRRRP